MYTRIIESNVSICVREISSTFTIISKVSKVRYDIPKINGLYRFSFIDVLSRYPFFRPVGARLQDLAPA